MNGDIDRRRQSLNASTVQGNAGQQAIITHQSSCHCSSGLATTGVRCSSNEAVRRHGCANALAAGGSGSTSVDRLGGLAVAAIDLARTTAAAARVSLTEGDSAAEAAEAAVEEEAGTVGLANSEPGRFLAAPAGRLLASGAALSSVAGSITSVLFGGRKERGANVTGLDTVGIECWSTVS